MSQGADPSSWKVVERGWSVVANDGSKVGHIEETVGDSTADIFNGLVISVGLLKRMRYVAAERVGPITEGQVELTLSAQEAEGLEEWTGTPPGEEILPE